MNSDPVELAEMSGLGDKLWAVHGARILRKFESVDGNGKIRNDVCYVEWLEAKRVFDRRREAADRTNTERWANGDRSVTDGGASRSAHTHTRTGTGTGTEEQKQKPSPKPRKKRVSEDGMVHSTNPRHVACKGAIFDYYRKHCKGEDPDWDGREGKALAMFLSANPKLTDSGLKRLLDHRARSDVNHADRPSKWIGSLKSYLNGPLNEFGKPKGASNGNGLTKGERNKQVLAEVLAELEHDSASANGIGDAEAGESR